MDLPPGPVYVLQNLHVVVLPSAAVYVSSRLARHYLDIVTPTWVLITAIVCTLPALAFAKDQYKSWKDRRAARSLGAILPPHAQESAFTVAKKAMRSLHDFPGRLLLFHCISRVLRFALLEGTLMVEWSKKYGYVYSVSRFTSRTVSSVWSLSDLQSLPEPHKRLLLMTQS